MNFSMKFSRILPLSLCAALVLVIAACSNNNDTGTTTAGEQFSFKQGDYSVYNNDQLDSANAVVRDSSVRSSRTIVRTGIALGGQTDAVLAIDTTFFGTTTRVNRIDTTYYRVANNQVFTYFDVARIGSLLGGSGTGFGALNLKDFQAKWVQLADLQDAPGSQNFPASNFSATTELAGFALTVTAVITGRNLGKTTTQANATTYNVHRQSQPVTVSLVVPVAGKIDIPLNAEYDFGIPSQGAPRTIIRTESKSSKIVSPLGMTNIPGFRSTLVSFRAGS
jgi:hypothetical protein